MKTLFVVLTAALAVAACKGTEDTRREPTEMRKPVEEPGAIEPGAQPPRADQPSTQTPGAATPAEPQRGAQPPAESGAQPPGDQPPAEPAPRDQPPTEAAPSDQPPTEPEAAPSDQLPTEPEPAPSDQPPAEPEPRAEPSPGQPSAREPTSPDGPEFAEIRATYYRTTFERLNKLDEQIRELEGKPDQASLDVAAGLRMRRDELATELEAAKTQTRSGWEAFEANVTRKLEELERDIERAMP